MDVKSPNSATSSSEDSDIFVQSQEDDHYSPVSLAPNRPKPGLFAFDMSKSDTESNRPQQESFKFQNESFGGPNHKKNNDEKNDNDREKYKSGIMKRNSRFSENQRGKKSRKSESSNGGDFKDFAHRLSIHGDLYKEPAPVQKSDEASSPNSKGGFFKKRATLMLTPAQIDMIDDKVTKNSKFRQRTRSFSTTPEKGKVRRSKLLQRISNIAARGSIIDGGPDNPASIFKQLLIKVNPTSLHKAEKDLKRRYIRKLRRFLIAAARMPFDILTPDAFFTIFWNFFVLILVIYDSIVKPFEVSFFSDNRKLMYFDRSAQVCAILFTFDIIFNFRTAFYNKGVLVTQSSEIISQYLSTNFVWDFITVIADYICFADIGEFSWYLKLISILRFKKLFIVIARTEDFLNLTRVMQTGLRLLKLLGTIMLLAHWLACFFHLIAFQTIDTHITWLHDKNLVRATIIERYVAASYWSIATMVTVGYGDVVPISVYERMYTILAMLVTSVVFGFSLNTVANVIKDLSYEKDQRREKISSVKHYMNQKNLGKNIQTRVKNYIQYIIDSRALYKNDEEEFLELLSQGLKDEIVSEVNGKILASSQIFSINFSHKASLNLAKYMKETSLAPEEVLFEEGDLSDCSLYFIAYGKIQLYHKVKKYNILEKGAQFGEVAFFSGQPRTASAKSLFFSNIYSLAREVALENLKTVPSDFEMFHLIKDNINLNQNFIQIELKCFSCNNRGHLAKDCNKIHYVADRLEIIETFLKRQRNIRRKFVRFARPKFAALTNLPKLSETAEMIQEDYSDYTISDEELSQDSLDVILERNLLMIPRAEANDLKARKVERRNKSTRYSAQALMGELINANFMIGTRFSQTSHVTKEDNPDHQMKGTADLAFFSIDKVENFEVYYPQHNIRNLIQYFEKMRFQQMLRGTHGTIKAMVLRNFSSITKDTGSRKSTKSPLFFSTPPPLQKQRTIQRGKKKNVDKNNDTFAFTSLNNQMKQAIFRAKSLKAPAMKTKNYDEESEFDSSYPTPMSPPDRPAQDTNTLLPRSENGELGTNPIKNNSSYDEATMSKKEINDERKKSKTKVKMDKLETLRPKTLTKIKLENSETNTHQLIPSSQRRRGNNDSGGSSPKAPKKLMSRNSSKKGTLLNLVYTKNSLDDKILLDKSHTTNSALENAILQAMVKEGQSHRQNEDKAKKTRRSISLEKMEDMKKAIHKFNVSGIIKNLIENPQAMTKTANFGD